MNRCPPGRPGGVLESQGAHLAVGPDLIRDSGLHSSTALIGAAGEGIPADDSLPRCGQDARAVVLPLH